MRTRSIALVVALLGVVTGVVSALQSFLPVIVNRAPSTLGLVYGVFSVVTFLLSPVALFLVGYWAGGRADVPAEWAALAAVFGVVGCVAMLVGYVPTVVVGPDVGLQFGLVLTTVYTAVVRGFDFAVTGLAGAAVAHFRNG